MNRLTRWILTGMLLIHWVSGAAAGQTAVNADAKSLAEFQQRVSAYAALHQKVEGSLPQLSKEATPQEIDRYQRSLLTGIGAARATARPGDLFTPPIQRVIKALIVRTFAQGDRKSLRESIQDENPGPVKIAVNGRYPDQVPLANMPAELLRNLPTLPDVLEYRFVGEALILLDSAAHLVVDILPAALPR